MYAIQDIQQTAQNEKMLFRWAENNIPSIKKKKKQLKFKCKLKPNGELKKYATEI